MARRASAALLLFGLASCIPEPTRAPDYGPTYSPGDAAPAAPPPPRQSAVEDALRRDPGAFITAVAKRRRFTPRDKIPILVQEDGEFFKALESASSWLPAEPSPAATRAFYLAFNFPMRGEQTATKPAAKAPKGKQKPKEQKGQQEDEPGVGDVLAFYDLSTGRIHVRAASLRRTDPVEARSTILHEIEHALQHQRVPMVNVSEMNDDQFLAHLALHEGDAEVTALVELAARAEVSADDLLAKIADHIRDGSYDRSLAADPRAGAFRTRAANERERLLFPYTHGLSFVGDLYRTGGFNLIDAAFTRPPETSEQILHPKKYLDGERAIPVRFPEPPAGFGPVVRGTMGELLTRVVLAQCLPPEEAAATASGWGGDAYLVSQSPSGKLVVSWATAWDDEASAARFARAMSANSICWKDGHAKWKDASISDEHVVTRAGNRVAFVRGLATGADDEAAGLLSLPSVPLANTPPFSNVKDVKAPGEVVVEDRTQKAWVKNGPRLARNDELDVDVPAYSCERGGDERKLRLSCDGASATIAFLPVDAGAQEPTLRLAEKQLLGVEEPEEGQLGPARLAIGSGYDRIVRGPKGGGHRVIVIPVCEGPGALVIALSWEHESGRRRMFAWADSVRRVHKGVSPPVCKAKLPAPALTRRACSRNRRSAFRRGS